MMGPSWGTFNNRTNTTRDETYEYEKRDEIYRYEKRDEIYGYEIRDKDGIYECEIWVRDTKQRWDI